MAKHRKISNNKRNIATAATLTGVPLASITGPIPAVATPSPDWNPIIHCESGGRASVINEIGAGGLFQFLPSTWQGLGGSGNAANASVEEQLSMANKLFNQAGYTPWYASKHCWDTDGDGVPNSMGVDYLSQLGLSVSSVSASPPPTSSSSQQVVTSRVWPAEGPITSRFREAGRPDHDGLDIGASMGSPVYAAEAGVVISSGPASGYGNWIRIEHADGTITGYGHMPASSLRVNVGDEVAVGEQIADVGSEGQSTGPHLHFFVMQGGVYIDPEVWLADAGHVGDEPAPVVVPPVVSHEEHDGPHILNEGETLSHVALWHGVSVDELVQWNGITDVNCIPVGTELAVTPPPPEPTPPVENEVEASTAVESHVGTYTVIEGDCLSCISDRLELGGWRVLHLRNLDQIKDPNLIYPGQVLTLP